MQDNIVMAFRKRLKNAGYKDISIYKMYGDKYQVQAREPLAGTMVSVTYPRIQLHYLFRKK